MQPILNLKKISEDTITEFKKQAKTNHKVQAFNNITFRAKDGEIQKLGCVLKRMKPLFQTGVRFISFSYKKFQIFFSNLKRLPLKDLKIYFLLCSHLNDGILKSLSQNLKHFLFLASLTLNVKLVTFGGPSEFPTSQGISMLFSGLKTLKALSKLEISVYNLSSLDNLCLESLSSALTNFHSLQTLALDFYKCSNIGNKGFLSFSKALKESTNLIILNLRLNGCGINDECIESISMAIEGIKSLSNLSLSLDLDGMKAGKCLFWGLRKLNYLSVLKLDFDLCKSVSDEEMKCLGSCFKNMRSLRALKLSFKSCELMTDDSIEFLAQGLASLNLLESLEICFIDCLKIQKIGSLACAFERLVGLSGLKLHFNKCYKIENQEIETLSSSFRHLNSLVELDLEFFHCQLVNDLALKSLSSNFDSFPCLQKLKLNFSSNPQISDFGLEVLSLNLGVLSSLLSLDLCFVCNQISDNGIKTFSLCLKKLGSLISLKLDFSKNTELERKE